MQPFFINFVISLFYINNMKLSCNGFKVILERKYR